MKKLEVEGADAMSKFEKKKLIKVMTKETIKNYNKAKLSGEN